MENHDSEESKVHAKMMEALYKKANLSDEDREKLLKAFKEFTDYLIVYSEKQKDGTLSEEEKKAVLDELPAMQELMKGISDFELLLGNKMFHDSEKLMEEYKKLGEAGNKEAEKTYKNLHKKWLALGNEDRGLN